MQESSQKFPLLDKKYPYVKAISGPYKGKRFIWDDESIDKLNQPVAICVTVNCHPIQTIRIPLSELESIRIGKVH